MGEITIRQPQVGVPVVGCPKLEEIFGQIYNVYLVLAILGERKFSRLYPQA
jgi:hypothetical protein